MLGADSITVPDDLKEYTDFSSDIDLQAIAQSHCQHAARVIRVLAAGSGGLSVVMSVNDGVPTPRPLTVSTGEEITGKFCKIVATGTSVTKIRVGW